MKPIKKAALEKYRQRKRPRCFFPGCEVFPWLVINKLPFCEEHKAEAKIILTRRSPGDN